ncbi:MAG TPA: TolC family protein, partial [Gemmatimonadaceae bacterium]|nr:TolC family protein [Gemmatimonadaceae bacterium]
MARHSTAWITRAEWISLFLAAACSAPGTPRIDGVAGAPPSPAVPWAVPAAARTPPPPSEAPRAPAATAALTADSASTGAPTFSLVDVVDLALRNNPATRESWALAQSAASEFGAARGALFPDINGNVNVSRTSSSAGAGFGGAGGVAPIDTTGSGSTRSGAGGGATRTQLTPAISLSYLVFDFGGRSGTIEAAKQRAIAADLTHNATINDVVLEVESAVFSYLANRALRDAQVTAVAESRADTAAAEARLRVGVGTLQDVLQTRTALAQAVFQLETFEGALRASRGTLAAAMGLQANARFDIPLVAASDSVADVAATVDTLINRAITLRPDVAEVRAEAAALAQEIRIARSAGYPALTLSSTESYARTLQGTSTSGRNSSLVFGLQIPVFNGFSREYQVRSAQAQYQAGLARVASTEQQVTVQVYASYAELQTARQRLTAAAELLTAAVQSAQVATGRYREGVGTIVDLLLARSALDQARAENIQARWEWRI